MDSGGTRTNQCAGLPQRKGRALFLAFLGAVIAITGASCVFAQDTEQRRNEKSCRDFVRQFYDWYVPGVGKPHHSGGLFVSDVLRRRPQWFRADLLQMLKKDSAANEKAGRLGMIDGLDFDPFLNTNGDFGSKAVVQLVRVQDGRCQAEVIGIEDGKPLGRVEPELVITDAGWKFVNFHYGSQFSKDDNLVAILMQLSDDRKKEHLKKPTAR